MSLIRTVNGARVLKLRRQGGVSLIEVLVALLVLSIGLVGLAGMQSVGLKFSSSAESRTQATALAYDIIDRMRINRELALSGGYDIAYAATQTGACASNCTPANLRDADIAQWKQDLADFLPSGQGEVQTRAGTNPLVIRVKVRWDDSRGEGSAQQELTIDSEL